MLAVLAESNWHPPAPAVTPSAFGRKAVQDFNLERVLDRLLVYERRIEHSLYRTMAELRKLRKEGGVSSLKWEEESSCQTNPICPGVSSVKSEVSSERSALSEEVGRGRPTHPEPPDGGTPNVGGDESCETNPIPEPDSAPKKTPSQPRPPRKYPNTVNEMTYDSFLGRWVWTGYALANKDSNQADAGRRQ